MYTDIRIERTSAGYDLIINGKTVGLYSGSQDARPLYHELKWCHSDLWKKLDFDRATRGWWRRIETGAASDNFIDDLVLVIEGYFRKKRKVGK